MTSLLIYFVFVLDIVFGAPFVTVQYNKVNSHDDSQFVMFRIPTIRRIINTPATIRRTTIRRIWHTEWFKKLK